MLQTFTLTPAQQPWIQDPGVPRLFAAIGKGGGTLRLVGGAVRDALIGRAVGDLDFAADLPPQTVMAVLAAAGIKTVPTGLLHGTVTAVIAGKGYEITTLRRDIETDGRRATVSFTDDWQADAARRDFTMNALYADLTGTVYDYGTGLDDLRNGRVRFIGQAAARIAEDYLRVLRFFRFQAWFGREAPAPDALKACAAAVPHLGQLSVERVWKEVRLLLAAPQPLASLRWMKDCGVWDALIPEGQNLDRLERLLTLEEEWGEKPDPLRRLAALMPFSRDTAFQRAVTWHFSNLEKKRLVALAQSAAAFQENPRPYRRAFYRAGAEARHALLLAAVTDPTFSVAEAWAAFSAWENPVFPLRGQDLLDRGYEAGPAVAQRLKQIENWWIEQDFRPDRAACLATVLSGR